jgi:hypothetical protein
MTTTNTGGGPPPIAAIETRYAGCRFRSRIEARWAVFFDRLGIEWDYEPQGYILPSGLYLADFHLPGIDKRGCGGWVEVKGQKPNVREKQLARELAAASREAVAFALAIPRGDERGRCWCPATWWVCLCGSTDDADIIAAYAAARSARFEHGETPARVLVTPRWRRAVERPNACQHCGVSLRIDAGSRRGGRPAKYCSGACRTAAHRARRASAS